MKHIQLSEEKYNQLATEVSDRLFNAHYFNKDIINGEEIKKFAEHNQVNKFLLFQIYQVWQMQMSKFRHSYFNFEGEEVTSLLKQLQNELSRNISIKKSDFKPLVKKAVYNNLKLLFSPKETLGNFFFQTQEKISLDLYDRYTPFFSDFDFVVNSLNNYYHKNDTQSVEKDVFFLKVDKVLELYNAKSDKNDDSYRDLIVFKLTDKSVKEIVEEDIKEKEARDKKLQEEASIQKEKEAREAKARDEAEQKKREEEEKAKKKEEEKKRQGEEKAKKEEEDRVRAEEESRLKEESKKKAQDKSFFDTLKREKTFFDLTEETLDTGAKEKTIVDSVPNVKTNADKFREAVAKEVAIEVEEEVFEAEAKERIAEEVIEEVAEVEEVAVVEEVEVAVEEVVVDKVEEVKTVAGAQWEKTTAKAETPESKKSSIFDSFASRVNPFARPENKSPEPVVEIPAAETPAIEVPEVPEVKVETTPVVKETKSIAESMADRFKQKENGQNGDGASDENADEALVIGDVISGEGRKIKPDEIPIHRQYQYVQKVFGGNNVRFRIIVDKVNNSNNKEEVEDILNKFVLNNSDVDPKDVVVQEFTKLLRARF